MGSKSWIPLKQLSNEEAGVFQLIWGRAEWGFPGIGPLPPGLCLCGLGTVCEIVAVSFSKKRCYKARVVGVDSSTILGPFGSNEFMSCLSYVILLKYAFPTFPPVSKGYRLTSAAEKGA